jgi:superfamily II DNA or RNA helicase
MNNLSKCKYRFGFTGTLDGSQTSAMVLTGLFGKLKKVITTSELIENKFLADFKIKCLVLQYPDEIKKLVKDFDYQNELDYIVTHKKRNDFIIKLSQSLEGNTLLLFQFVEKHGKVLFDSLKDLDRPVYYIHGGIDGSERNEVRNQVESDNNAIIVASVGAFSTGINIKNLKNIIFASPSKSRIRTLQSIGRVLRKSETKTDAILFDIADNLSWKKKKNYTIIHFLERLKIYQQENFPYKIHNVEIK